MDGVDFDAPIEILFDCFYMSSDVTTQVAPFNDSGPPSGPVQFSEALNVFWPVAVIHLWVQFPAHLTIYQAVRQTALPNYLKVRVPVLSALNIKDWRAMLVDYQDIQMIDHLEFWGHSIILYRLLPSRHM